MAGAVDYLERILVRKRVEVARRIAHRALMRPGARTSTPAEARGANAIATLRRVQRGAGLPRVIAEIKLRSPSAGEIRRRHTGVVQSIAESYAAGGAAALSVLCDGPGFGGSALDFRRAAAVVRIPLLFKEFVLDPIQVEIAHACGASMVLLIVRALEPRSLAELVDEVHRQGMEPVVEAADDDELERALATRAVIVGVNARDLRTFRVDGERARRLIARIPEDRVAVHMSGLASGADLASLGQSRADAVLVGEALMRAPDPGARLQDWIASATDASVR